MPSSETQFKPGNPGGPGRGLSGRRKTLDVLDNLLSKAGNQKKLEKAFQEAFDKDPLTFWKTYVMPVLPKEIELEAETRYQFKGHEETRQEVAHRLERFLASLKMPD